MLKHNVRQKSHFVDCVENAITLYIYALTDLAKL